MRLEKPDIERAVRARYSRGAKEREESLCCPIDYDPKYLDVIPREILEKDYGCGDPSKFVKTGETVLDLGSGAGKICYIAAQVVGPTGRVLGVDANDDMLALARKYRATVAENIGYSNVEFLQGEIQNLEPIVSDESIDVVISNCVLNLVAPADKQKLFREIVRVLQPNGRAVISDIVSDQEVPCSMQEDPGLWSGCISGALQQDRLLQAFADAGMQEVQLLARQEEPWKVVEGIEFRSVTVAAFKEKAEPCCAPKCC